MLYRIASPTGTLRTQSYESGGKPCLLQQEITAFEEFEKKLMGK